MRSISPRILLAFVSVAIAAACSGGSSTTTTTTQTMTKVAGDNQSGARGSALVIKPAVKITDQSGAAVSGVSVTFAITAGNGFMVVGGSSTSSTIVATGADGIATVPNWQLGAVAGPNTMTASASGVTGSPVTFTATGTVPATILVMSKAAGDAQSVSVGTSVPIAPAVLIQDVTGLPVPVAGVTVTFAVVTGGGSITGATATTNAQGIATVGSWTLGPAAGANTVAATASGINSGSPATFNATGIAVFSPTSNTTLSGTQTLGSVNIPAGVTVTMTSDVTLNVIGAVNIAGTLIGNCVNLTIMSNGVLTSTGNINNSCTGVVPASAPPMLIVATGGYHVTAGTITTSGGINITNDATLTDATFPAPPVGLVAPSRSAALRQAGVCFVGGATFVASPATAKAGVDGQFGTNGTDGSTWILQCTGELDVLGGLSVFGQNGGNGGNGTHSSATAAIATGGNGGKGGIIKVRSNNGDLVLSGASNNIQSGNGGNGGTANATGTGVGNPGASATSTGGNGNAPGNIVLQAKGGGITIGTVTLTVGSSGNGGSATSIGGNGQDATPCPAGLGGVASATGGAGGSTPDKQLTATGSVTGVGGVTVAGGAAGTGGAATSTSGNGGAGAQACKAGGNGGAASALGGKGGDALLKDQNGVLVANGAKGGAGTWFAAKGGQGWNDCVQPFEAGGNGGVGGTATGADGNGGNGKTNGAAGGGTINVFGNGGNGGSGAGPGAGGGAGAQSTVVTGGLNIIQQSFQAGLAGAACILTVTPDLTAIPNSGGTVSAGSVPIPVKNGTTTVGTITYKTTGTTFTATSPTRVGEGPGSILGFTGLTNFFVNSVKEVVMKINVCVLNAPGINASNPVTVKTKDVAGNVIATTTIGSQTCVDVPIQSNADSVELTAAQLADLEFIFSLI